jgi:hypothetical protein
MLATSNQITTHNINTPACQPPSSRSSNLSSPPAEQAPHAPRLAYPCLTTVPCSASRCTRPGGSSAPRSAARLPRPRRAVLPRAAHTAGPPAATGHRHGAAPPHVARLRTPPPLALYTMLRWAIFL